MMVAILIVAFIGSLVLLANLFGRGELRAFDKHQRAKQAWRKLLEN